MNDVREDFKDSLKNFIMGIQNMKKEEVLKITDELLKDSDLTEEEKKIMKELTQEILKNKE